MTLSKELKSRVRKAVDQFYGEPSLSAEQAKTHWTLALEVREHLTQTPDPLPRLEDEIDMDVSEWLLDLPFNLANHGLVDEAVTLGARYAEVTEAENFLGDRAVILAEAARREEALTQVTDNLTRFADDPWVTIKSGDVYEQLGDLDQAERLFRQGLELAGDDDYTRSGAVERLIPLLDRLGRNAEADALVEAETARDIERKERLSDELHRQVGYSSPLAPADTPFDPFAEPDDFEAFPVPYTRPAPKFGRNDPCPCGSGTKYKKCCLRKSY
jgi:tetratricopeptide (TPR) repeat protein